MKADYSLLTEIPGDKASLEQIRRMHTRYHFARQCCKGKNVLEVACGAGQGLGYIARDSNMIVGGDYERDLLNIAKSHYKGTVPLCRLDAQFLPFVEKSFDVIILYEAIYYLKYAEKFISECHRVLKPEGLILICLPNRSLPDFHPSPYSFKYFTPPELKKLIEPRGFMMTVFGDTPVDYSSFKARMMALIKKTVVKLNLMPKTLKGREFLKRIAFGTLVSMPGEINEDLAHYDQPRPILSDSDNRKYKIIFAVARKL